ncbi:MAG: cytochrome c family protein [Proteobacteria bacterium]|nr:cytochrome c family protein [Pseudomonadota bacterium]
MSGMEFNKLFAAILVAGILAMLAGFISKKVVHVEDPHENAFAIEVAEAAGSGAMAVEAVAEPILALLATADVAKGQSLSKVCAACHTFNKGEPARVGPNLYGIVGSKHAHMEGFAYSEGMKALHDKSWDYASLNAFLWNPKKAVSGTKMVFAGMKKPEDRAALIAYLRSLSDSPAALPSDAEIAAEAVVVEKENADIPQEPQQAVEKDKDAKAEETKSEAKPAENGKAE